MRPRGRSEGIARSRRRRGVGESEHDPPRPGFAFRVDNIKSAPIRRFSRRSRGWGTHRLVAGDGGLELLGGLEHLNHLERGVWVCGGGWVCDARRCVRRPRDASRARSPSRRRDSRSTLSVRFLRLGESTNRQRTPPRSRRDDPRGKPSDSRAPDSARARLLRAPLHHVLNDVSVRAARDGHGHQGDGGGEDPRPPPRGGVLQRHHGQERAVRREGPRGGGQAREAARVLQPGQVRATRARAPSPRSARARDHPRTNPRARGKPRAPSARRRCSPPCLDAIVPDRGDTPPRFLPTAFRLPAMVEGAQGEIKVVQQKWANRMELPMTEVRLIPPPPLPARDRAQTRRAFFPRAGPRPVRETHQHPTRRPFSARDRPALGVLSN